MAGKSFIKDPIEALQSRDALGPCPSCGGTNLGIDPKHPLITFQVERRDIGDAPKMEMLAVVCKNCGRLALHDPFILGVLAASSTHS